MSVEQLAELASVKKERQKVGAKIKRLEGDFWFWPTRKVANAEETAQPCIIGARSALAARRGERQVALEIFQQGLRNRLNGLVQDRRQQLVRGYENWWEKYGLSFQEIEEQLTGTAEGAIASNPWSQQSVWEVMAGRANMLDDRVAVAELIHSLRRCGGGSERRRRTAPTLSVSGPIPVVWLPIISWLG